MLVCYVEILKKKKKSLCRQTSVLGLLFYIVYIFGQKTFRESDLFPSSGGKFGEYLLKFSPLGRANTYHGEALESNSKNLVSGSGSFSSG
jgi:hypothetical protein